MIGLDGCDGPASSGLEAFPSSVPFADAGPRLNITTL